MNPVGHLKISLAFLIWLVGFAVIGLLLGRGLGLIIGLIIAFVYAICALMAPDKLPIDIYEGRLMMREEDTELLEMVDDLATKARIPAPDLYILALDQPNVLAWATSNGKVGFSRIGIPPDLRSVLSTGELQAVMALAVARIASGEAALLARGASMAGLVLQAVYSPVTNFTLGFMRRDPDTGLTALGTALFTILAPFSKAALAVTDPGGSWSYGDHHATVLLGNGAPIASALRKLSGAAGLTRTGALRGYNPALIGLFVVSPLERLVTRSAEEAAARRELKQAAKDVVPEPESSPVRDPGAVGASGPKFDGKAKAKPVANPKARSIGPAYLGWSARVAAWIADAVPPIEIRTYAVSPNTPIE